MYTHCMLLQIEALYLLYNEAVFFIESYGFLKAPHCRASLSLYEALHARLDISLHMDYIFKNLQHNSRLIIDSSLPCLVSQ